MTKNLILITTFVLFTNAVFAQERFQASPGLTSNRLEIRDPKGRISMTVERSLNGHLIIKRTDGSIIGSIKKPNKSSQRKNGSYLSLPPSWTK